MRATRFWIPTLLLLGACSTITGLGWRRVVGNAGVDRHPVPPLEAPAEVRAGASFDVTVVTFGSSSCTRPDGAEVERRGLVADITPYDRVAPPGVVCTADMRAFPRQVTLRFDAAGEALVRVRGRGGDVVAEQQVTVTP